MNLIRLRKVLLPASFSKVLCGLIIGVVILTFLVVPLSPLADPGFWRIFYERFSSTTSFRVARSLGHMAPSVGFSALISYLIGSFASRSVIGTRHSSRLISLCFMYSLYGVVFGYILGASTEPVTTEAITSLVTIVAAAFSYLISKDLSARFKAMVPPALICFLLTLMFTAHYYASIRAVSP
jgi:hypothetical protein